MANIHYVNSRDKLKKAIENQIEYISIKDQELGKHVSNVKKASKAVIAATMVGSGVACTMWWNPIGWLGGLTTVTVGASVAAGITYLIHILGVDSFLGLYKGYKIIGQRIAKLDDNTVVEGELILQKK
jgi:predicted cation transporter